jgi:hypothetical protein
MQDLSLATLIARRSIRALGRLIITDASEQSKIEIDDKEKNNEQLR